MYLNNKLSKNELKCLYKIVVLVGQGKFATYITDNIDQVLNDLETKKFIRLEKNTVKVVVNRHQDPKTKEVYSETFGSDLEGFQLEPVEAVVQVAEIPSTSKAFKEICDILTELANVKSDIALPPEKGIILP